MSSYRERMAKAARKKRPRVKKRVFLGIYPFPNYETNCPTKNIPSLNERVLGALPKRKAYTSTHTIAPAFNKGPYMVISHDCIKDIGK